MNPAQILSVLSAPAAAVLSVRTWSDEQQKERQLKRDQKAALSVNSFMSAIAELLIRFIRVGLGARMKMSRSCCTAHRFFAVLR